MNAGCGKNLNWFWKRWFFDNGVPDLAIAKVLGKLITVEMKGTKPVPVDITITYTDNSTEKIHSSIAVWERGNTSVQIAVSSAKKIKRILLGSTYVPDVNKKDNAWEGK